MDKQKILIVGHAIYTMSGFISFLYQSDIEILHFVIRYGLSMPILHAEMQSDSQVLENDLQCHARLIHTIGIS